MPSQPTAVIVEDDLATQALLAAVARRCGLNARMAGDGEAGLALILAECPAVLIIDLVLPRLSGLEVLERLRDVAPGFLARTVVVSADDSLLRGNAEVLRSVSCVLRKPFDIDLLGDELRRCIAIALSTPGEVPSSTRLSRSRGRFH